MTGYVATTDLIDRIGEDELYVLADRDRDGALDPNVIEDAAADAAAEIDAYLGTRYNVPLIDVPRVIKRLAVDITVYRLADAGGRYTEERRKRYEDAIALLRRINSGEVGIGLSSAAEAQADKSAVVKGGEILVTDTPPRVFGRNRMGGWPT